MPPIEKTRIQTHVREPQSHHRLTNARARSGYAVKAGKFPFLGKQGDVWASRGFVKVVSDEKFARSWACTSSALATELFGVVAALQLEATVDDLMSRAPHRRWEAMSDAVAAVRAVDQCVGKVEKLRVES